MLSAESFISTTDAKALSMEETEFEKNMEFARSLLSGLSTDLDGLSCQIDQIAGYDPREPTESRHQTLNEDHTIRSKYYEIKPSIKDKSSINKIPSMSELENTGATMLLKEDQTSKVFREYPTCLLMLSSSQAHAQQLVESVKESEDNRVIEQIIGLLKDTDRVDDGPNRLSNQEDIESNFPKDVAVSPSEDNNDDTSER
ncbi:hypothetical protein CRYUN_Cryun27aG0051000 [Craigia yunnanensis]